MARMSGKKLAVLRMPIAAVTACNALLFLLAWDPASTWMANSLRLSAALMFSSFVFPGRPPRVGTYRVRF